METAEWHITDLYNCQSSVWKKASGEAGILTVNSRPNFGGKSGSGYSSCPGGLLGTASISINADATSIFLSGRRSTVTSSTASCTVASTGISGTLSYVGMSTSGIKYSGSVSGFSCNLYLNINEWVTSGCGGSGMGAGASGAVHQGYFN